MARRKKTPTDTVLAYRRERRRIQSAIRRLEKRGYYQQKEIMPDIPKRITAASIRRLQRIDLETLYKKAVKVDFETGEMTSGLEGRKQERAAKALRSAETRKRRELMHDIAQMTDKSKEDMLRRAKQKRKEEYPSLPREEDIILSNFRSDVISRFPGNAGPMLLNWLNKLESQYDRKDIARMLQNAADAGLIIDYKVAYNEELLLARIAEFMDFLPGASIGFRQELIEELEYHEDWEEPV